MLAVGELRVRNRAGEEQRALWVSSNPRVATAAADGMALGGADPWQARLEVRVQSVPWGNRIGHSSPGMLVSSADPGRRLLTSP